ncbi:Indoleamine 2,3-dioxygenase [Meira miltonrushii]|uniref:Indoleamine 2,3-dioxygenase n=1 Tax=Meira miltonrushii TaxID=1280837 RepID=A0A316VEY4_9BASI|nr:Indoleamine 2,3-dioxygenase [Meira miltonrushii]PWN36142.1 Indoleamine 2,3-dioxygenase [Meira miltonrushii]
MPDTSTLAAADYDVDVRSGFLPPQEPVYRLQGIEEELWETALDRARSLPLRIGGGGIATTKEARKQARQWRRDIRQMLILHPSPQLTSDIRFARRAHLVLAFLVHFYMHNEQDQIDEAKGLYHGLVPASLAIPWVALSNLIDIPPVLTYATTVMWNWSLKDTEKGFTDDNLRMTTTFSGTRSEEHFYMTSVLIEKRGVEALTLMRRSLDEAFVGDTLALRRMRSYIRKLAKVLKDLQQLLHDVRTDCDPTTFYWGIRPWFNGADSYIDKDTGEKGWIYEGVEEYNGKRMLFMGPSAGQSSLIHVIDVFMGVDHSGKASAPSENGTFMERMQTYMPGHHRNFLNHLRNISFVDDEDHVMEDMETDAERLREAYNEALNSLKHLRDEHMRIATLYIVSQMRKSPPAEFANGGAKGTGGTDLVSFLRDCRKNTVNALFADSKP